MHGPNAQLELSRVVIVTSLHLKGLIDSKLREMMWNSKTKQVFQPVFFLVVVVSCIENATSLFSGEFSKIFATCA